MISEELKNELLKVDINNQRYLSLIKEVIKEENINLQDSTGWTLLMHASYYNQKGLVKLLIKSGANVELKDVYGYTAIMQACIENNKDIVELLIKRGVDLSIKTKNGETTLDIAMFWDCKEVIDLLSNQERIEELRSSEVERKTNEELLEEARLALKRVMGK